MKKLFMWMMITLFVSCSNEYNDPYHPDESKEAGEIILTVKVSDLDYNSCVILYDKSISAIDWGARDSSFSSGRIDGRGETFAMSNISQKKDRQIHYCSYSEIGEYTVKIQAPGVSYISFFSAGYSGKINGLEVKGAEITSLNISRYSLLEVIDCSSNRLTSLNVSGCTALKELICPYNELTSIDISKCIRLQLLNCYGNPLTSLNVSKHTTIQTIDCGGGQLSSLNVSGCTALCLLDCRKNQLTSLNISGCTTLKQLYCHYNQLTSLNVSRYTELTTLCCRDNYLTSLNIAECTALNRLDLCNNRLKTKTLNTIFENLPTAEFYNTIFIANNPGSEDCDKTIATEKLWRVILMESK